MPNYMALGLDSVLATTTAGLAVRCQLDPSSYPPRNQTHQAAKGIHTHHPTRATKLTGAIMCVRSSWASPARPSWA